MTFPLEEVQAAVDRFVLLRERIDAGQEDQAFGSLTDLYTDDAVIVDASWGRIEGKEAIGNWFIESMVGLEDWKFPIEFTAINGNDVIVKWTQLIPGLDEEGRPFAQSAYSRLIYAGNGKFSYEEDTYNMEHVLEDVARSGWRPKGKMNFPPSKPNRRWQP